jgi:hypothetical protein
LDGWGSEPIILFDKYAAFCVQVDPNIYLFSVTDLNHLVGTPFVHPVSLLTTEIMTHCGVLIDIRATRREAVRPLSSYFLDCELRFDCNQVYVVYDTPLALSCSVVGGRTTILTTSRRLIDVRTGTWPQHATQWTVKLVSEDALVSFDVLGPETDRTAVGVHNTQIAAVFARMAAGSLV